eukprot:2874793-Pyramimonas_sp.AAC.1
MENLSSVAGAEGGGSKRSPPGGMPRCVPSCRKQHERQKQETEAERCCEARSHARWRTARCLARMGSKAGSAPWRPAGRRAALRGSRCWRAGRASGAERRAAGRSGRRAPRASCAARCCCWRQYAGRKPAGSARAARARPCAPGTTGPGRLRRSTSPGGPHAWR